MEQKRVAIMQPYFYPYIGYFHLLHAADVFVLYDNIEYTKKGWINRNRILEHGSDAMFSVPLEKASDYCRVDQRMVSETFDRGKLLSRIRACYGKAPHYRSAIDCFRESIECSEGNLYRFIKHSIGLLCDELAIETPIIESSKINIDHNQRGQEKVLAICKALGATSYVNAIGGMDLYDPATFEAADIRLRFVQSVLQPYRQFENSFVPWLSILDLLMFNDIDTARAMVHRGYTLVPNKPGDR